MKDSHELKNAQCKPCEGYGKALELAEAAQWLKKVPGWNLDKDQKLIWCKFKFKGFYKTMGFVNAVAWISNQQNHHPTLEISYDYCLVKLSTHALKGLTPNDFICAAKISELLDEKQN